MGSFFCLSFLNTAAIVFLVLLYFVFSSAILFLIIRNYARRFKPADLRVLSASQELRSPINDKMMLLFTFLGKHPFLISANLVLIFIFLWQHNQSGYPQSLFLVSGSGLLLMFILKHLFRRQRPKMSLFLAARGKSFPSGHAIMAIVFYGFVAFVIGQTQLPQIAIIIITILLGLLIAMIGLSRVYLQVHYLSDVLAGFIIGLVWLYVAVRLLHHLGLLMIN